jgi:hypothetical protein
MVWVSLALAGLVWVSWALVSFDRISYVLAAGYPALAALMIGMGFVSGFCFCLSALWYWAALRWVDKHATWS